MTKNASHEEMKRRFEHQKGVASGTTQQHAKPRHEVYDEILHGLSYYSKRLPHMTRNHARALEYTYALAAGIDHARRISDGRKEHYRYEKTLLRALVKAIDNNITAVVLPSLPDKVKLQYSETNLWNTLFREASEIQRKQLEEQKEQANNKQSKFEFTSS